MSTVTDVPASSEETTDERLERQKREQRERLEQGPQVNEFGEPWQDSAPEAPSLVLDGSHEQLSFEVGGKEPTTSYLTLTGGQVEVASGFSKGEKIVLTIEATVQEVAFRDETDSKTQQVVGAKRKHKARITGVRPG